MEPARLATQISVGDSGLPTYTRANQEESDMTGLLNKWKPIRGIPHISQFIRSTAQNNIVLFAELHNKWIFFDMLHHHILLFAEYMYFY